MKKVFEFIEKGSGWSALIIILLGLLLTFLFPHICQAQDFSIVLSEQETSYAYRMKEKQNRASNVELAAKRINGIILQPGEIFSYNELVGARTEKNGFKKAPEIIQGNLVDGIGGGVCQVSGTIHAAMLQAGMVIIESTQHTRHSLYIDPGLDSTVSWPRLDLKMQNNYPFPIKIVVESRREKYRGYLNVKIMGAKQIYKTFIINTVHSKKQYKTQKIFSHEFPKKFVKVVEAGTYEMSMTRTRKVYRLDTGELVLEETRDLRYNDSDRILIIGLGPK